MMFFPCYADQGWIWRWERSCCDCDVLHGRGADLRPQGRWPEVNCTLLHAGHAQG